MEGPQIPDGDAQSVASLLIATAAGGIDEVRAMPLVDTETVDAQLGEVMQGYRAPGG